LEIQADAVEVQSHFSCGHLRRATLAGNDLTQMSDSTRDLYTNTEAIAVDQAAGRGAQKVKEEGGIEVWMKLWALWVAVWMPCCC